jgi:hypothetical protein
MKKLFLFSILLFLSLWGQGGLFAAATADTVYIENTVYVQSRVSPIETNSIDGKVNVYYNGTNELVVPGALDVANAVEIDGVHYAVGNTSSAVSRYNGSPAVYYDGNNGLAAPGVFDIENTVEIDGVYYTIEEEAAPVIPDRSQTRAATMNNEQ